MTTNVGFVSALSNVKLKKNKPEKIQTAISFSRSYWHEFLLLQWKPNMWLFHFSRKIKLLITSEHIFWPFCIECQHKRQQISTVQRKNGLTLYGFEEALILLRVVYFVEQKYFHQGYVRIPLQWKEKYQPIKLLHSVRKKKQCYLMN